MTEKEYRELVAARLMLRRRFARLTQKELAEKANLNRNIISAYERAARSVDAWDIKLIAEALEVGLDWLLNPVSNADSPDWLRL